MKTRTSFHRTLLSLCVAKGLDSGLKGLAAATGIPYQRLCERTKDPKSLRMYEEFAIEDELELTDEQILELREAIRGC